MVEEAFIYTDKEDVTGCIPVPGRLLQWLVEQKQWQAVISHLAAKSHSS